MQFKSYKSLLNEISKKNEVILTVSLWTYSSGRMTFKVPFDSMKDCFDGDMLVVGNKKDKVVFTTVSGKEHSYWNDKLKIAKLDSVDIKKFEDVGLE